MDTLLADKDSKLHFVDPSTSSEDYTGFTTAAVKWRGKSICKHSKKKTFRPQSLQKVPGLTGTYEVVILANWSTYSEQSNIASSITLQPMPMTGPRG